MFLLREREREREREIEGGREGGREEGGEGGGGGKKRGGFWKFLYNHTCTLIYTRFACMYVCTHTHFFSPYLTVAITGLWD
jgi:hypothetical protein